MSKILIVDDDHELIDSLTTLLKANGYEIISAFNGETGYTMAKNEKPDLMLLDVMMSHDLEGFDIVKKLKKNPDTNNIPVIIITGIRKEKTLPFKYEPDDDWLPVKAVMEKPVKPEDLLNNIKEALKPVNT